MKAKELIEHLKTLPPDTELVVTNGMGCPAYDYEGQKFSFTFDRKNNAIKMKRELDEARDKLLNR